MSADIARSRVLPADNETMVEPTKVVETPKDKVAVTDAAGIKTPVRRTPAVNASPRLAVKLVIS